MEEGEGGFKYSNRHLGLGMQRHGAGMGAKHLPHATQGQSCSLRPLGSESHPTSHISVGHGHPQNTVLRPRVREGMRKEGFPSQITSENIWLNLFLYC